MSTSVLALAETHEVLAVDIIIATAANCTLEATVSMYQMQQLGHYVLVHHLPDDLPAGCMT